MAIGALIGTSLLQMGMAYQQGQYRAKLAKYQAKVKYLQARHEANLQRREAASIDSGIEDAVRATAVAERRLGERTRQPAHRAEAIQGAAGFVAGSGNSRAVLDDIYRAGSLDQRELRVGLDIRKQSLRQRQANLREAASVTEHYGRPTGMEGDAEEMEMWANIINIGAGAAQSYMSMSG